MGFMDKMKAAAQDAATQAKKATNQAQTKMEESQVRKKMDESAKKLGYLIYRERSEGTPAGADADTTIAEIKGYEAKLAELQSESAAGQQQGATDGGATQPGPSAPPAETPPANTPPTSASEPTGGDFKL